MQLITAEYSTHIRANVRVYRTGEGDYRVDWQFSHGGCGARCFLSENEAIGYYRKIQPGPATGSLQ
jgi:hypothetical protein